MKLFYKFSIGVSLLMALMIFLNNIRITKLSTEDALKLIENHCLRQNLSNEENAQYQSAKKWILRNDNAADSHLEGAKYLGWGVCLILLIQNVISLRYEIEQTRANADIQELARKMRERGLM